MAAMTRRFEQLLIMQDERQAKLFAELFVGAAVDVPKRPNDVAEQTVSLCVRKSDLDGGVERLDRGVPTYTEAGDSETSIPAAVPEAQDGTRWREPGETLVEDGEGEKSGEIWRRWRIRSNAGSCKDAIHRRSIRQWSARVCVLPSGPVKLGEALS